jgi:hypothetical protein
MKTVSVAFAGLVAVLLGSLAQAQPRIPDFSGNDAHWIEDKTSHCWAANPDPAPNETISWTGGCENMLLSGEGTLTWYENGRVMGRDEGVFRNGELTGHGKISFADGASFEGEFPGEGVLTAPDGRKVRAQSVKEAAGWSVEQIGPQ